MSTLIKRDEFADTANTSSHQSEKEKKINLKIEKDDLLIIDRLCQKYDISRTTLLNELLAKVFWTQIQQIGDVRLETLLLLRADLKAGWEASEIPWSYCYHGHSIDTLIRGFIRAGCEDGNPVHLEAYSQDVLDRFDAIAKFFNKIDEAKKNEQ